MRIPALLFLLLISVRVAAVETPVAATGAVPDINAPRSAAMMQLQPFAAGYEVRLNNLPFKAKASQTLTALGNDRWRLELRIDSFLLDTLEYSEFRWDGKNCRTLPERYGYTRNGIGRDRRVDMQFDFTNLTVSRRTEKAAASFSIAAGTEDKLGHTLSLACKLARGTRKETTADVAWDNEVRHFEYRISSSEETVVTPAGEFRALRLERKRADSDRTTTSWLAANAGWQAVQMQHSEGDGRLFQLRLLEMRHDR